MQDRVCSRGAISILDSDTQDKRHRRARIDRYIQIHINIYIHIYIYVYIHIKADT